jgi:S1-C subfamily serine protease
MLNIKGDMKNIILLTLFILIINLTQAFSETTYSAFTEGGKALVNELSILSNKEKFRIIFFTDKTSEYQLVIKPKNKPADKQIIKIIKQFTLPPDNDTWFHLGKAEGLTVQLSNSDSEINLEFRRYELKNNSQILNEQVEFIGEEEIEDYISYPHQKNNRLTNETFTVKNQFVRVRSAQRNIMPKKYRESVVFLETPNQFGAGFLVAKNRILTNWHLIKGQKVVDVRFKAKLYPTITKRSARKAQVILIDKEKDLALLELGYDTSVMPFTIRESTASVMAEVHTFGHPYGLKWSFNTGVISNKWPDYPWNYKKTSHKAKLLYQTQIPVDKGNSGGPLLDDNGRVLGIVTYFHPQNKNINFSVSSKDIKRFLARKINPQKGKRPLKVKSKYFDSNNDGKPDGKFLDTDNDGIFETRMIYDSKSKATIITKDKNRNGIVEERQEITKSAKYKKIAVIYIDLDDDGDWDKLIIDYRHDGNIEFEENI